MQEKRLKLLTESVPKAHLVLDIGCDHGYVSEWLAERADVDMILAMDISAPSLEKLTNRMRYWPEEKKARIRALVSDGFSYFCSHGEEWKILLENNTAKKPNVALLAGMGGDLMVRILREGRSVTEDLDVCIFSPHTGAYVLRKELADTGWNITSEYAIFDGGKYYEILCAERSATNADIHWSKEELEYGPILLRERPPALLERWRQEEEEITKILEYLMTVTPKPEKRIEELQRKQHTLRKYLEKEDTLCG